MARVWISALGEPVSHYFTRATVGGQALVFAEPRDAAVHWNPQDQRLTLSFTRSEEHTSELQSLMRISYAVFCLKKNKNKQPQKATITSAPLQQRHTRPNQNVNTRPG